MIRRLTVAGRTSRPVRILAISDEVDPSLSEHLDREAVGPLDLLVSSGDLPPDYLSYVEGVLRVPFVFVRGNHDLDGAWRHEAARLLPAPPGTKLLDVAGLDVITLDWPGADKERTPAQNRRVWREVIGLRLGAALHGRHPLIVASHVAPHDSGDARDAYHRGFPGYRWLADQVQPALWLHGHVTPASEPERVTHLGPTTCVNVTGAYLIELAPETVGD